MKKRVFKITLGFLLALGVSPVLTSCVDEELNINPKSVNLVPSANLLGSGLYQTARNITSPNVNLNNYVFFTQHLSETGYVDEVNYTFNRNQPRTHFNNMYVQSIGNFKQAKISLAQEVETNQDIVNNKLATIEIAELLAWENLVNTYGNIPYSESFQADESRIYSPKYDDAKTIYIDLLSRLDAAINLINVTQVGYSTGGDFAFNGNMDSWKKTANALKLRLGLNLADTDAALAKQAVESAYQSGVYQSYSEALNFKFDQGIYFSPFYSDFVASGRKDFTPSTIVIDMMKSKNDSRLDVWFTKVNNQFIGGPFGSIHPVASVSNVKEFFLTKEGPLGIVSYTEVLFMLAEAAQRGFSVGNTAQYYYEEGIKSSFQESGISSSAASYIAANPYNAANWKKSIGEEVYISLFTRGYASWNFTRRLDYPALTAPTTAANPLPVRMPYSDQEYLLNSDNVNAAAVAIGGDNSGTKLFWDRY